LLLAGVLLGPAGRSATAQPPRESAVVAAEVTREQVSAGQSFVGTVRPLKRVTVGSAVDGRVVEYPIKLGQRVEEGGTLAQLLTDTISLEVQASEAELTLREQELAELTHGSRPEEIEQARARMEAAAAARDYLGKRRTRVEKLYADNATSEDLLQEAVSQSLAADETYLDAKAAWDLAVAGPRDEKKAQAQARHDLQRAVVDRLKDQLQKHTVITRFSGYVSQEFTEIGAWVAKGEPVAEILELDQVEIEAFVLDSHVAHVDLGEEVTVTIPALAGKVFRGPVVAVVPQANETTRTFPVRVQVANEIRDGQPLIKAGMLARVILATGPAQEATLVPKDALVLGGPVPMVFVVSPDEKDPDQKTARPVPVEIGVASGGRIQVLPSAAAQGAVVKPGDQVVVLGNERLRPGQPVKVTQLVTAESPQNDTSEP
jgi:RND family efflux transporter MFP subunit